MGPLAGVKVLEIAGIGPGPFAAMMLADMGADVIRIDRASRAHGGDPAVPPKDPMSRGRRSIAVDLKHPDGIATVLAMLEQADGLFEGFRPGVMERLGLGHRITEPQSLQAGACQDDRVILAFVQFTQTGVDIAAQITDQKIRPGAK